MEVTGNELTPMEYMVEIHKLLIGRYGLQIHDYSIVYNNIDDNNLVTLIYSHNVSKGQIRVKAQFYDGDIVQFKGELL